MNYSILKKNSDLWNLLRTLIPYCLMQLFQVWNKKKKCFFIAAYSKFCCYVAGIGLYRGEMDLTLRGPCLVIYSYKKKKANEIHSFSTLFW